MSVSTECTGPPTVIKLHFVRKKGISGVVKSIAS